MFTIETVENLEWCDSEKTSFNCLVKYAEFSEKHPTGVLEADQYAHIKELWVKGNAGEYGVIAEYIPPPPPKSRLTPATGEIPLAIL
ncbi:MAG: hypothetical protein WBI20_14805 [Burkholderiaceae bacterium]